MPTSKRKRRRRTGRAASVTPAVVFFITLGSWPPGAKAEAEAWNSLPEETQAELREGWEMDVKYLAWDWRPLARVLNGASPQPGMGTFTAEQRAEWLTQEGFGQWTT